MAKSLINVDMIYPIGSIYISVNNTNPSNIFGGSWSRINGWYLYANESGNDGALGETFGSQNFDTEYHGLTQEEMPTSVPAIRVVQAGEWSLGNWNQRNDTAYGANLPGQYGTSAQGLGHKHKFYPPSLRVCMWKRTA